MDGEGSFMIQYKQRNIPVISMTNTDRRLVEVCQRALGGKIYDSGAISGNRKRGWKWYVMGDAVIHVARQLAPYLLSKQRQAWLLAALPTGSPGAPRGKPGRPRLHPLVIALRESAAQLIRPLNRRGARELN